VLVSLWLKSLAGGQSPSMSDPSPDSVLFIGKKIRHKLRNLISSWVTAERPVRAIALVSMLAVLLSTYPVVFSGKSYVSPNYDIPLLYGWFPTLPGYTSQNISPVWNSDVGAIMWAHVPYSMIQHRALLHDGELPLWNRYNSGGVPLLGQGQSMFGDPLHLFVILADGASWAWDLKYLVAKWLFAAGLGLLVLAVTRHLPAALIVSLAAPFAGFFVYRLNHPAFFSLCYAPWPLYCLVRVAQARSTRATIGWIAGLLLANLALMNSGTVKEAYMLLFMMNFSGACVVLSANFPWPTRLAKLGGLLWAGILFTLVTAPVWLTFIDSLRGAYTFSDSTDVNQISPFLLLGAFDEGLFRWLQVNADVFNPSANFLILAGVLYFLATLRYHLANRAVLALALSSLVPLSLVFGLVPAEWISRVPFLTNVGHIDSTFMCGLIVLWSVLAGAGFAAAAQRLGTPKGRGDLLRGGLLLSGLVLGFVIFHRALEQEWVAAPEVVSFVWHYLALLLISVMGLGLLARQALIRLRLNWLQLPVIFTCTLVLLWRQGLHDGATFIPYAAQAAPRVDFQAPSPAVHFVQESVHNDPARVIGVKNCLYPGWSGVYRLEGFNGPDALMNPYYRQLASLSALKNELDWRYYIARDTPADARRFLDFMNVRYYFDQRGIKASITADLRPDYTADLAVYTSPTAWPRAFFTNRLEVYETPGQLMARVLHGDGRPFAAIQASDFSATPSLAALVGDQAGRTIVAAGKYHLSENKTSFEIRAPSAGIVILEETWWHGYSHARIDGQPTKVVRINHTFQGVLVSPGVHTVSVSYAPEQLGLALKLSVTGLVLILGSGLLAWKRAQPAAA
jgi:hypothetical protein